MGYENGLRNQVTHILRRNNINRKYTVIYYHSMATSLTPFVFIRDMFKKLPIQYYALLDKIYVV